MIIFPIQNCHRFSLMTIQKNQLRAEDNRRSWKISFKMHRTAAPMAYATPHIYRRNPSPPRPKKRAVLRVCSALAGSGAPVRADHVPRRRDKTLLFSDHLAKLFVLATNCRHPLARMLDSRLCDYNPSVIHWLSRHFVPHDPPRPNCPLGAVWPYSVSNRFGFLV